ncbi:MAG: cation efflux system protein/acriflavin resistance protein family [Bacteroidota bacterium]|jgi:RND family efflux transporter MFP subunit
MKQLSKLSLNVVVITLLLASCGKKDNNAQLEDLRKQHAEISAKIKTLEEEINKTNPKTSAGNIIQVTVTPLNTTPFFHYIDVQGKVTSDKNIIVTAKVPGTVTGIFVQRGQAVRKGTVLATLDAEQIIKGINEAKSSLSFVTELYNRQKSLWDQKIGTEVQYLQAKNQKESLENKIESLNEQYAAFKITSPIDGVVDEVIMKVGEMANPGFPAFRVINTSSYKATAEIAEAYVSKVQKGDKVAIEFPDINETIYKNIDVVSNVINVVNRTFNVEINLGASNKYKANMVTFLKIQDYANNNATVIPINLIQRSENEGDHIFVAENGVAKRRIITVGKTYGNDAEIISGLKVGDQIITVGYQELTDGQVIKYE